MVTAATIREAECNKLTEELITLLGHMLGRVELMKFLANSGSITNADLHALRDLRQTLGAVFVGDECGIPPDWYDQRPGLPQ